MSAYIKMCGIRVFFLQGSMAVSGLEKGKLKYWQMEKGDPKTLFFTSVSCNSTRPTYLETICVDLNVT